MRMKCKAENIVQHDESFWPTTIYVRHPASCYSGIQREDDTYFITNTKKQIYKLQFYFFVENLNRVEFGIADICIHSDILFM